MVARRVFTVTIVNDRQEELCALSVRADGHVDVLTRSNKIEHLTDQLNNVLHVQFLSRGVILSQNVVSITGLELAGTVILTLHCEPSVTTIDDPTPNTPAKWH
jgi:uncharacterized lipoprotein YajG